MVGSEIAFDHTTSRVHFVDENDNSLQSVDLNGNDRQYHVGLTDTYMVSLAVVPDRDVYYYAFSETVYMHSYSGHEDKESAYEGDYIEQVSVAQKMQQKGTFLSYFFYFLINQYFLISKHEWL